MTSLEISIILPVYNGAQYLQKCLQSIRDQQFSDYEVLIGDDASTDISPGIIDAMKDNSWRIFRRAKNQGLFPNLNDLLRRARSPLVRFLCQDDVLMPDSLGAEVQFFDEHPSIAMSYCKANMLNSAGGIIGQTPIFDLPVVLKPALAWQYYYYLGCLPGNLSTVCARRQHLEAVGLFDEDFQVAGDFDLWVRMLTQGDLGIIHRFLIGLRLHDQQLSKARSSGVLFVKETRRIRQWILCKLPLSTLRNARGYTLRRQTVHDVHYAVRCLLAGRVDDFRAIARIIGPREFGMGLFLWLATANGRIRKPKPVIAEG